MMRTKIHVYKGLQLSLNNMSLIKHEKTEILDENNVHRWYELSKYEFLNGKQPVLIFTIKKYLLYS